MKLQERYKMDGIGNRSEELVYDAVEALAEEGTAMCGCEECVMDLVAWTLNHVTPRYYTSLLSPLTPDPALERKVRVEIDLAISAGLKRLREHPHHS